MVADDLVGQSGESWQRHVVLSLLLLLLLLLLLKADAPLIIFLHTLQARCVQAVN